MLSLSSLSASLLFIITYEFIIIVIIISIITIVFLIILLLRSLLVSLLFLLSFLLLLLLLLALLLPLFLLYRGESIFILFERYRLPLPIRSNLIGKSYSVSMFVYMLFLFVLFSFVFFLFSYVCASPATTFLILTHLLDKSGKR